MARRRLLTDKHWAGLLALPSDEHDVVRHCTLAPEDLAALAIKRAYHNRLGYALPLCAMRHPGRVLDVGEVPPASMVAYVARQIGTQPAALRADAARRWATSTLATAVSLASRSTPTSPTSSGHSTPRS